MAAHPSRGLSICGFESRLPNHTLGVNGLQAFAPWLYCFEPCHAGLSVFLRIVDPKLTVLAYCLCLISYLEALNRVIVFAGESPTPEWKTKILQR